MVSAKNKERGRRLLKKKGRRFLKKKGRRFLKKKGRRLLKKKREGFEGNLRFPLIMHQPQANRKILSIQLHRSPRIIYQLQ